MTKGKQGKEIKRRLRELIPMATMDDFLAIEEIAMAGHLRHLPASIRCWQAITTRARHAHTEYDRLMEDGYDTESARHFVFDDLNEQLAAWGCKMRVDAED